MMLCVECGLVRHKPCGRAGCNMDPEPLPASDKPSDAELVKRLRERYAGCLNAVNSHPPDSVVMVTTEGMRQTADALNRAADNIERLAASRLSVPREGEWLPIAGAPKNGTQLLLWNRRNPTVTKIGEWYSDAGLEDEGYWRLDDDNQSIDPTHYQPLPKSPA